MLNLSSIRSLGVVAGAVLALTPLAGQSTDDDALERIRSRVRTSLERLPDHTCRIDIRRTRLTAKTRSAIEAQIERRREELIEEIKRRTEDRRRRYVVVPLEEELRSLEQQFSFGLEIPMDVRDAIALEAAFVAGKELYAFPDSPRFEEIPLAELIGHGTVSTGAFAGHITSLFTKDLANFSFVGSETLDGEPVRRYDYVVSVEDSEFELARKGYIARLRYGGSLWATEDGDELRRLTVNAHIIPEVLGVTRVSKQIDYQSLELGSETLLLAKRSRLSLLLNDGVESLAEMLVENCRSFVGSSVLSFDDDLARFYVEHTEVVENLEVPEAVRLPVTLSTPLDSEIVRVGTRVEATLAQDVAIAGGAVLPEGALLRGRVRRLEFYPGEAPYFGVGLEFQELLFDDRRAVVALALESIGANVVGARIDMPPTWTGRQTFERGGNRGVYTDMRNADTNAREPDLVVDRAETAVNPGLFGVGEFYVSTRRNRLRLGAGLKMTWRTVVFPSRADND